MPVSTSSISTPHPAMGRQTHKLASASSAKGPQFGQGGGFSLPDFSSAPATQTGGDTFSSRQATSNTPTPAQKRDLFLANAGDIPTQFKTTQGRVSEKDLDDCGELIGFIEQNEFKNSYTAASERAYMAQYCNRPRSVAIVVRDPNLHERDNHPDGDVIATGTLGPEGSPTTATTSYIPTLYVDSRYRRLEDSFSQADGYTEATLMTSKTIAPKLYEKAGFTTSNGESRMKQYSLPLS